MEFLHALDGTQAYLLLCALVFIEEVGIPLPFFPGDLILLAAGYLAAMHRISLVAFLVLAYVADVAGALICYRLTRLVGRPVVLRLGRHLHVTPVRLDRAERWLERAGAKAIAIARVLPGTRINSSIAAGCLRMPMRDFLIGVLSSTPVWLCSFTLLGYLIGDSVTPILPWIDRAILLAAVVTIPVAVVMWRRRRVEHLLASGAHEVLAQAG